MSVEIGATFDKILKQRIFMLFSGNREATHTYSLVIATTKNAYAYGESAVVTGTLLRDNQPVEYALIYLYMDDNLVGTTNTASDGTFTKSIGELSIGNHSFKAYYSSTESNTVSASTNKIVTDLDINVPLNLVYSDEFLITGTLTSATGTVMSNKSVNLIVGSTVVDNATTNNQGVVTFTRTPVTMGTHTFQLQYIGDSTYADANSQSVTREIGKETAVISLTAPPNNLSMYTDDSVTVTGALSTNDNEKLSGKSILIKDNGTTIATYTTGGNGAFTGSVNGFSSGTHTLSAEFETDTYYTASSISRTLNVIEHTYTITASASQSIIANTGSVTISGVLERDSQVYANQTVTIYDGSTSKGTATTNSNGEFSKTISSLSVGTHTLKVSFSGTNSNNVSVRVCKPVLAQVTGSTATLGYYSDASIQGSNWLVSTGDVLIDWGDGSTSTVNNPTTTLTHNYSSSGNHTISLIGDISGIGVACFNQSSVLTSINVPNTVTSVGDYAFYNCTNLSSVTLPNTITSFGKSSFRGCSSLTSVTLPTSLSSVGQACFRESGLTSISIPSTLTALSQDCFYGCSSLASTTIPNSVITLGNSCFYGCSALSSITLSNATTMGENCFRDCTSLTSASIPSATSLGKGCFRGTGLTSITLPNTLNEVAPDCFFGCSSLTSISLPNTIRTINQGSFFNCTGLTSFNIPSGVTTISTDAFAYCSNMITVTIPSSVTTMGATPFRSCSSLAEYRLNWTGSDIITYNSNTLPNSTNTIFLIPIGESNNYIAKSYPSNKIGEELLYDDGTSDDYFNYNNYATRTVDSTGILLNADKGSDVFYMFNIHGTPHSSTEDVMEWGSVDFCCEFDLVSTTAESTNTGIFFFDTGGKNRTFSQLGVTNGHIKVKCINKVINFYLGGSSTPTSNSITLSKIFRFGFRITSGKNVKYKNLRIYSI